MVKISARDLSVWYGDTPSLQHISLDVEANQILTLIGPANSGKTTFLKCLNRLVEAVPNVRLTGEIKMDGKNIREGANAALLRRKVGIIFALPVPLPTTVFENVVYGLRRQGMKDRAELSRIAEQSLKDAFLWDEVSDRLDEQAMKLSGGQQQRLCMARSLAVSPEVLLLDEPCSALDPISTAKIENALVKLKHKYTVILVTNNTKQAARVGDKTAFFLMGELVEVNETAKMFTAPKDRRTDDYISGRFG